MAPRDTRASRGTDATPEKVKATPQELQDAALRKRRADRADAMRKLLRGATPHGGDAAEQVKEQRLLASMDRAYREQGPEIREEMRAWDATLLDGLTDEH